MQIGVVYPQTELRGSPEAVRLMGKRSRTWALTIG